MLKNSDPLFEWNSLSEEMEEVEVFAHHVGYPRSGSMISEMKGLINDNIHLGPRAMGHITIDLDEVLGIESREESEHRICSSCGSTDLTRGTIYGASFRPKGKAISFFDKNIATTACKKCGHIDLWGSN